MRCPLCPRSRLVPSRISIGADRPGPSRQHRAAEKALPELQSELMRITDFLLRRERLLRKRTIHCAHRGAVVSSDRNGDRVAWNVEVEWHGVLLRPAMSG